jgi:hypothetical protein
MQCNGFSMFRKRIQMVLGNIKVKDASMMAKESWVVSSKEFKGNIRQKSSKQQNQQKNRDLIRVILVEILLV